MDKKFPSFLNPFPKNPRYISVSCFAKEIMTQRQVQMLNDREIITRIRQGEKELFGTLAERYYQDIYRFCYYLTGNREDAYDCTQETFLRLIRFLDSYVDKNQLKAWLFSIARNVCNDLFRSRKIERAEESLLEGIPVTETRFSQVEAGDDVRRCLERLPDYQREVIVLRFYYEFKIREIARIVGAGVPTVKSRLRQGMEKLKKWLSGEGGYGDDR